MASPTQRSRSRSQLAPRAMARGKHGEGCSRTPRGPSEKATGGISSRGLRPARIGLSLYFSLSTVTSFASSHSPGVAGHLMDLLGEGHFGEKLAGVLEIGRASCRERVQIS